VVELLGADVALVRLVAGVLRQVLLKTGGNQFQSEFYIKRNLGSIKTYTYIYIYILLLEFHTYM
jgi:hypothetical protein